MRYGEGALAVNGLAIRFASAPSAQDTFAAQQLAAGLSAAGETGVLIDPAKAGPAILLNRVGQAGGLPGGNDSAGPDSRDAYSLEVKPEGAEVRAGSSAGLFYGVQTLLQMVEGHGHQAALPAAEVRGWWTCISAIK